MEFEHAFTYNPVFIVVLVIFVSSMITIGIGILFHKMENIEEQPVMLLSYLFVILIVVLTLTITPYFAETKVIELETNDEMKYITIDKVQHIMQFNGENSHVIGINITADPVQVDNVKLKNQSGEEVQTLEFNEQNTTSKFEFVHSQDQKMDIIVLDDDTVINQTEIKVAIN